MTPLGTPPGDVPANPAGVELAFTLACAGVVALGLVAMVPHWRRTGHPVGVLVLVGAMASTIQEPMVDTLGNMFIPPAHYPLFATYGREMPWFAPFGYGLYFGIPMFLRGPRVLAVPVLVVCAITGSYYAQGWPIFSAPHAEHPSPALLAIASLATVSLGLAIIWACARVLMSDHADRSPATQASEPVHSG